MQGTRQNQPQGMRVGTHLRQPDTKGPTSEALHKASLSERERAENGRFRATWGKDNRNANENGRMHTVRRLTRECDLTLEGNRLVREVAGKKRRNCEESPELKRRRISQRQGPPRKSLQKQGYARIEC